MWKQRQKHLGVWGAMGYSNLETYETRTDMKMFTSFRHRRRKAPELKGGPGCKFILADTGLGKSCFTVCATVWQQCVSKWAIQQLGKL